MVNVVIVVVIAVVLVVVVVVLVVVVDLAFAVRGLTGSFLVWHFLNYSWWLG